MNKTSRMIATSIKQIELPPGTEDFMTGVRQGVALAALALSNTLAREYPAFDKMNFLRSCGVQSPPEKPRVAAKERRRQLPQSGRTPQTAVDSE